MLSFIVIQIYGGYMTSNIIITDVGSTTTKAILLQKSNDNSFDIVDIVKYPTTVEKPEEDVNIAINKAFKALQKNINTPLFSDNMEPNNNVQFFSTSSAGGGLQIIVIGLTMFDSASSGKRTAFGAGGVILDTFAIDDKRNALQQMQTMHILHPDIILMAGGVDKGNVNSLIRLAEILQLAKPTPKFGKKNKIPLVFAGNKSAQSYIKWILKDNFQIEVVSNIRPTLKEENPEPARKKIHQLFMDNVMEQAPGYGKLKQKTNSDIIPTPLGVIKSLKIVSEKLDKNLLAVDIGGATTDIFSNILGEYFRTVSANYGMSYSISNVAKDIGFEKLIKLLPSLFSEDYIRNYISNKMLYPTYIPTNNFQLSIEHAIAKLAIQLSKKQHFDMNFNTEKIGFLDDLKRSILSEKITETFYYQDALNKRKFHMKDIDILIACGGVISSANYKQLLYIMNLGFNPEGITEVWKDKHFLTPHMGVLSNTEKELASKILIEECIVKIGLVIRPFGKQWKSDKKVITIKIDSEQEKTLLTGDLKYFDNPDKRERSIKINLHNGFEVGDDVSKTEFNSKLPILIDCRPKDTYTNEAESYEFKQELESIEKSFNEFIPDKTIVSGVIKKNINLPYPGEILVKKGDKIEPGDLIGKNVYDPPKVYILTLFDKNQLQINKENIKESLIIKEGDEVKLGQKIAEVKGRKLLDSMSSKRFTYSSPVRGRVEKINHEVGTIILREIQDYSDKPVKVKIAKRLDIKPKKMKKYLKKNVGNFVYSGDLLASKVVDVMSKSDASAHMDKYELSIQAPSTGTITNIDFDKGTLTIKYEKEPFKKFSDIYGIVENVEPEISAELKFNGYKLLGIIGFGNENSGKLHYISELDDIITCNKGEIAAYRGKIDQNFLKKAEELELNGVISASIDNKDLINFIGEEIGVALTGNEKIPFPYILTEGFGDFEMCADYKEFLKEHNNEWCHINGHTQIRAGVTRPKIIINKKKE